jgi:hypothetical protein
MCRAGDTVDESAIIDRIRDKLEIGVRKVPEAERAVDETGMDLKPEGNPKVLRVLAHSFHWNEAPVQVSEG